MSRKSRKSRKSKVSEQHARVIQIVGRNNGLLKTVVIEAKELTQDITQRSLMRDFLKQLADPANQRPVEAYKTKDGKVQTEGKVQRYDTKTGRVVKRDVKRRAGRERGRAKNTEFTKKTVVTLAPADAKIELYNDEAQQRVGLIFDRVKAKIKSKYVFEAKKSTDESKWWVKGSGDKFEKELVQKSTPIKSLIRKMREARLRGETPKQNEVWASLKKEGLVGVFAMGNSQKDRCAAYATKAFISHVLDVSLPVFVIGQLDSIQPVSDEQMHRDLQKVKADSLNESEAYRYVERCEEYGIVPPEAEAAACVGEQSVGAASSVNSESMLSFLYNASNEDVEKFMKSTEGKALFLDDSVKTAQLEFFVDTCTDVSAQEGGNGVYDWYFKKTKESVKNISISREVVIALFKPELIHLLPVFYAPEEQRVHFFQELGKVKRFSEVESDVNKAPEDSKPEYGNEFSSRQGISSGSAKPAHYQLLGFGEQKKGSLTGKATTALKKANFVLEVHHFMGSVSNSELFRSGFARFQRLLIADAQVSYAATVVSQALKSDQYPEELKNKIIDAIKSSFLMFEATASVKYFDFCEKLFGADFPKVFSSSKKMRTKVLDLFLSATKGNRPVDAVKNLFRLIEEHSIVSTKRRRKDDVKSFLDAMGALIDWAQPRYAEDPSFNESSFNALKGLCECLSCWGHEVGAREALLKLYQENPASLVGLNKDQVYFSEALRLWEAPSGEVRVAIAVRIRDLGDFFKDGKVPSEDELQNFSKKLIGESTLEGLDLGLLQTRPDVREFRQSLIAYMLANKIEMNFTVKWSPECFDDLISAGAIQVLTSESVFCFLRNATDENISRFFESEDGKQFLYDSPIQIPLKFFVDTLDVSPVEDEMRSGFNFKSVKKTVSEKDLSVDTFIALFRPKLTHYLPILQLSTIAENRSFQQLKSIQFDANTKCTVTKLHRSVGSRNHVRKSSAFRDVEVTPQYYQLTGDIHSRKGSLLAEIEAAKDSMLFLNLCHTLMDKLIERNDQYVAGYALGIMNQIKSPLQAYQAAAVVKQRLGSSDLTEQEKGVFIALLKSLLVSKKDNVNYLSFCNHLLGESAPVSLSESNVHRFAQLKEFSAVMKTPDAKKQLLEAIERKSAKNFQRKHSRTGPKKQWFEAMSTLIDWAQAHPMGAELQELKDLCDCLSVLSENRQEREILLEMYKQDPSVLASLPKDAQMGFAGTAVDIMTAAMVPGVDAVAVAVPGVDAVAVAVPGVDAVAVAVPVDSDFANSKAAVPVAVPLDDRPVVSATAVPVASGLSKSKYFAPVAREAEAQKIHEAQSEVAAAVPEVSATHPFRNVLATFLTVFMRLPRGAKQREALAFVEKLLVKMCEQSSNPDWAAEHLGEELVDAQHTSHKISGPVSQMVSRVSSIFAERRFEPVVKGIAVSQDDAEVEYDKGGPGL